jgi:hypothetical protein
MGLLCRDKNAVSTALSNVSTDQLNSPRLQAEGF